MAATAAACAIKASAFPPPEPLEARIAPATLDLSAGTLQYLADNNIANALTIDATGAKYFFNDPAETITIGPGANVAGYTGNGTHIVSGPTAPITSISLILGDQNDTLVLNGLLDSLNASTGSGMDKITVGGSLVAATGNIILSAETLTLNAAVNAPMGVTLSADTLAVGAAVTAGTQIIVHGETAGRPISLGAEVATSTSLIGAELDLLNAPTVQVGETAAGQITVSASLSPANADALSLITGAGIIKGIATASFVVQNLALQAVGSVVLDGANDVDHLAAEITGVGSDFSFTDADGFQMSTVDGVAGLTVPNTGTSVITLHAGAVTQAAGAKVSAQFLELLGAGPFTLQEPNNQITTLSANLTGALGFTDFDGLNVGSAGGTLGITTVNSPITLAAGQGDLKITDSRAGADINAGSGAVTLTAGAVGQDFSLVIDANAGITGSGGVTLIADKMSIGATVSGGAGGVVARPFENTTAIDLGGADGMATLGLTDPEIDLLSGVLVKIGGGSTGALTVSAAITPGATTGLDLIADSMAINQTINFPGFVVLEPATATMPINLGNEVAGSLSLTDPELDRITVTSALRIGGAAAGDLSVSAMINAANTATLALISGGNVLSTGGSIVETNLRVSAAGGVDLPTAGNNVGTLAVAAGSAVTFFDGVNPLIIGSVDGVIGVSASGSAITLTADSLNVQQAINAGTGIVTLRPETANRAINLGTATGAFDLTDGELDLVTAGVLRVGQSAAGAINLSSAISPAKAGALTLITGAGISGAGSIAVAGLRTETAGAVTLTTANDVDIVAANITGAGNFSLTDADGFALGTVDGISGLVAGGAVSLNAGPVTQAAGANVTSPSLVLLGAGPFTLTSVANDVNTIAANVTGAVSFTDLDDLTVGSVAGVAGVTTSNAAIALGTVDGALTLTDTKAGADVNAGASTVTLTAGSAAGQDRALTINASAGVTGTGGVTLSADNLSLGAAVDAGAGIATVQPFEVGTLLNLGDADAANTLGLTDPELDLVTAGVLRLGSAMTGVILIDAPIDAGGTGTLSLFTRAGVSTNAGITETNLQVSAPGDAFFNFTNAVGTLATATGGKVSFNNGSTPLVIGTVDTVVGVVTTNDDIFISAKDLDIQQPINAGTASVTLSNNTAAVIHLGTATGGFDLSDVELDRITAGELEIVGPISAIDVSSAISPAHASRLHLDGLGLAGAGSITVATLSAAINGNLVLPGANDVDTLFATTKNLGQGINFANAHGFTVGEVGTEGPGLATLTAGTSVVALASSSTFTIEIDGTTPGTEYDQLAITGAVDLGGAILAGSVGFTPVPGSSFVIIDNDGTGDAVTGTFAGLVEGGLASLGGHFFNITYKGGDGNDVVLLTPQPLAVTPVNGGKVVTFTDLDGDLVTVKTSVGTFTGSEFVGVQTGAHGGGLLQALNLGAGFSGAKITFSAKPQDVNGDGTKEGNKLVNVGSINAAGVDLGGVKLPGDLGQIDAGHPGDAVAALLSLDVQSLGAFGLATQGVAASLHSDLDGDLKKLTVKGAINPGVTLAVAGQIGAATITGDLTGATITALGLLVPTDDKAAVAIKKLSVGGNVANSQILAGYDLAGAAMNADVSIGTVSVKGAWTASSLVAGIADSTANGFGRDDTRIVTGGLVGGDLNIIAKIASLTIKLAATGSAASGDFFGITAEQIVKAKINGAAVTPPLDENKNTIDLDGDFRLVEL
ncbi:MAG: trimeric autotransporter adhesin [Chthoniobacter sp.]|jgi:hypothetical protein|nr:trimeric autotransporter adhesin [Chthoniobacter sp.]